MERESRFKEGQVVLYRNGNTFQLGIVKTVVPTEMRYSQKQDGPFGTPTGEKYTGYTYFVNYHMGDTVALTNEQNLVAIENDYVFEITRKTVE